MKEPLSGAKIAERLLSRPEGATMDELVAATGTPQYNLLKRLEVRGYAIRKVKEGNETRYFAHPPAAAVYEAAITSKGQVTIPKEVRERLRLSEGDTLRFACEPDDRVVIAPAHLSLRRLFGVLGKPPRHLTVDEMDEVVRSGVATKHGRDEK